MKKRACDTFTSPAFPARWRAARRCDISSKRSLRVPRRRQWRPCLAAKFHAFPRTSSIDSPPSSPGEKTKVDYESSEHLATRALVPAELRRQDHLAFGPGGWRSIPLTPPFRRQAPLRVGSRNCVFHSPPSSDPAASVLAFRYTRQRRRIPGAESCRREEHHLSKVAFADDRCRRGFATLRTAARVDFGCLWFGGQRGCGRRVHVYDGDNTAPMPMTWGSGAVLSHSPAGTRRAKAIT